MAAAVLLDTCAAIWIMKQMPLSVPSRKTIQRAYRASAGVYISPFSAWEVGMLVSKGRVTLTTTPDAWFDSLLQMPGIRLAPLTPKILLDSSALPGAPPADPADRIIAATARLLAQILITRDTRLLDYARQGHIRVQSC
jgi:PIN domain nuclease of toxin-antitoxin system